MNIDGCQLQTKKKYLLDLKRQCELCGDPRKLEVHRIIPRSLGGSDDLDNLDNLIVIRGKCHGVLTPKSELTKIGQRSKKPRAWLDIDAFYIALKNEHEGERLDVMDMFDLIDRFTVSE